MLCDDNNDDVDDDDDDDYDDDDDDDNDDDDDDNNNNINKNNNIIIIKIINIPFSTWADDRRWSDGEHRRRRKAVRDLVPEEDSWKLLQDPSNQQGLKGQVDHGHHGPALGADTEVSPEGERHRRHGLRSGRRSWCDEFW